MPIAGLPGADFFGADTIGADGAPVTIAETSIGVFIVVFPSGLNKFMFPLLASTGSQGLRRWPPCSLADSEWPIARMSLIDGGLNWSMQHFNL
jgi:hypothetical protein